MDEKDRSKSPIREEILMISEDNKYRISLDPEEWVTIIKRDHVLIIFCCRKEPSEQCKEEEDKEEKKPRIVGMKELVSVETIVTVSLIASRL